MENIKDYLNKSSVNEAVETGKGYTIQPVVKKLPMVRGNGSQYLKIDTTKRSGRDQVSLIVMDTSLFDMSDVRNGEDDGSFDNMCSAIGINDWWTEGEEIDSLEPGESYTDPYGYVWVCLQR